jgi:hypothetical protein
MILIKQEDLEGFLETSTALSNCWPLYVPPLDSSLKQLLSKEKNPLFRSFAEHSYFVAYQDHKPIGRIVAHIHHASNFRFQKTVGYFGVFEVIDHSEAAKSLLEAAETWLRERKCTKIMGNFNLTAMQQMGVVTAGFEHAPFTDQVYNSKFIPDSLRENGYCETFPMTTFKVNLAHVDLDEVSKRVLSNDTKIQKFSRLKLSSLLEETRSVLNASFANNPFFVPPNPDEFAFQAQDMMLAIIPEIARIAFCRKVPVGVAVCLPDQNPLLSKLNRKIGLSFPIQLARHKLLNKRAVMIFYGVSPEAQSLGLMGSMLKEIIISLRQNGFTEMAVTWIADSNIASLKQMERLRAQPMHRLALFEKSLTDGGVA